jgi:hypothetical protein
MTMPDAEIAEDKLEPVLYYISFERIEQLNRSAVAIVAARRGPSCPSLLQPEHELTDAKKLVGEIAKFCADEPGFVRHDMPIQEMVFRMLLLRGNQPTPLEELYYDLTEKWASPTRPISITQENLNRVLASDTFYGFSQYSADD